MQIFLLFSLLAVSPTPAAAEKAQCDAKPFTLKKPIAQAAPQPPKPVQAEVKIAQATPPKKAAAPKPKIIVGCKQAPAK